MSLLTKNQSSLPMIVNVPSALEMLPSSCDYNQGVTITTGFVDTKDFVVITSWHVGITSDLFVITTSQLPLPSVVLSLTS